MTMRPLKTYLGLVGLGLLIGLVNCQHNQEPTPTSPLAQTYVDRIVDLMQNQSVHRKTIDWTDFKQQVNAKAQGAQTIANTYPAIQLALTLLADNHSSFTAPDGFIIAGRGTITCTDEAPTAVPTDPQIGYVRVTGFSGTDNQGIAFAQAIQTAVKQMDADSIRGWIVDLRGNGGGNMFPMLAGIGPILGEGVAGYFVDPSGTHTAWSYQQGSSLLAQIPLVQVAMPYALRKASPRVAVLTNAATASSGEAIAVSFKGRPNTRSFGNPTCGLSTANTGFTLSDGALLLLTTSTLADRAQTEYGHPVVPDEVLASSAAVARARAWLLQ